MDSSRPVKHILPCLHLRYGHMLTTMRPCKKRRICCRPLSSYFKPRGIPLSALDEVVLKTDEVEALRLADCSKLYHSIASGMMNISRQTFGRILNSAHHKVALAILEGKVLRLDVEQKGKTHENLCSHKKQQRPAKRSL